MCDPCMVPLTSQALLRAELLPSGAPILHLGSDYLAMLKPGAVADAPAAESAADSPDDTKGPPSAKAADSDSKETAAEARRARVSEHAEPIVERNRRTVLDGLNPVEDPLFFECLRAPQSLSVEAALEAVVHQFSTHPLSLLSGLQTMLKLVKRTLSIGFLNASPNTTQPPF
ncbi:hypothetical protein cyc_08266 [Cyclospora cayetanensis]|uniref:Uncharacterized protein n=1 Tax=Cyclospora cayetanensis TaxID=88456 RepID=A0A1D3CZ49_9EIME|nr:hypothetical protein cyc_08266 [Cyclospora cayetanensis]